MNAEFLNRLWKFTGNRALTMRVAAGIIAFVSALIAVFAVDHFMVLTSTDRFVQDWEIATLTPPAPQDPNIVIAAINEDTLQQFPYRSPVDRAFVSNLLVALAAKHPRAIGVDLLFDQPTEAAKDKALYNTLRDLKVPVFVSYTDQPNVVNAQQSAYLNAFVPQRARVSPTLAEDQFGTVRWIYPGGKGKDGRFLFGFARGIARAAGVKTPNKTVPIVWHGQPSANIPAFREFPAQTVAFLPQAWFKDKIVLIGSDLSLTDRHRTPFAATSSEGIIPGIVIHAHSLAQLLEHEKSPYLSWWANLLIAFAFAAIGAVLGLLSFHLVTRIGIGFAILVVLWVGGAALYHYSGKMIGLLAPSLSLAMGFSAMDSLSGRDARRQRQFIQGAFSRYVSPKVVDALIADPARMALQGERREMTYIFTDIKNSTTFSEVIDSRELAPLLNDYFDGVTQIILRHEGTVDKFIGDAVFAIFNAPVDLPDHAERAVRCALEIDDFAQGFCARQTGNKAGFGYTRIGVHTGTAVVGNFGSKARFSYTAQGDAVNTASRLEGLNKHFGTRIAVSGATREQCKHIRFRPIASVVLKGKVQPIDVWEPLRDGEKSEGFLERYSIAFHTLEHERPEAAALFEALADEAPNDPCVKLHRERLSKGAIGVAVMMDEK